MKINMKLLSVLICILLSSAIAHGTELIIYQKVFTARNLSGQVQMNYSGSNGISDILVSVCSQDWKETIASTRTDENGTFTFTAMKEKKVYYLQLSKNGFNIVRVKVQTKHFAKKNLILYMTVAT